MVKSLFAATALLASISAHASYVCDAPKDESNPGVKISWNDTTLNKIPSKMTLNLAGRDFDVKASNDPKSWVLQGFWATPKRIWIEMNIPESDRKIVVKTVWNGGASEGKIDLFGKQYPITCTSR
jgi:hypothetical protein